jgi:hypothetical protein
MLDTYIKNKGITKTIFHDHNKTGVNEINWDADYDGKVANISVDLNTNGHHKHYDMKLNNSDLANILNVPSVNVPLHKRLQKDFKRPSMFIKKDPNIYKIKICSQPPNQLSYSPILKNIDSFSQDDLLSLPMDTPTKVNNPLFSPKRYTNTYADADFLPDIINSTKMHLSSPKSNEEFIIPVTIDETNTSLLPTRKYKKHNTHKSYKVYKKYKTLSSLKSKKRSATVKNNKRYTRRTF